MKSKKNAERLLEELEFLFEGYSNELRTTTQPYQLSRIQTKVDGYEYYPDDILTRETLIEHVGSLPMLAAAFYPYIADEEVDLGKALRMLAIHDIGELITGDESVFTKKADSKIKEKEAALKLLNPIYHEDLEDIENQTSKSAKFAKAIDKINPDIIDLLTPAEITISRYKHYVGVEPDEIIDLIIKFKRPYMLWNPFMTEFHKLLMSKLEEKLSSQISAKR